MITWIQALQLLAEETLNLSRFSKGANTLCFVFLHTLSIIPEQQQSGNSDCLSAVIYIYLRSHKTYNENIYCYADLLQLSKQNV